MIDAAARRFEQLCVADIMIPIGRYPGINANATLRDALELLERSRLEVDGKASLPRVLLVFDDSDELAGILRRRDVMRGLEPGFLITRPLEYRRKLFDIATDPNLTELSFDRVVKGIREQAQRPVAELMRKIDTTVAHDDHLIKAIYEMVGRSRTLLPVVERGKVVGVLRTVELLRELGEIVR